MQKIEIYDTTLRDGVQSEGISYSVMDKIRIAHALDALGIDFIEAGNPGSNPRDAEFFEAIKKENIKAEIVAFGSTHRRDISCDLDKSCRCLLEADTKWVAIFGKCWLLHVRDVLQTSDEENLAMIEETVKWIKAQGRSVIFDAEHFFDGYKDNRDYAIKALKTAECAGADRIVLCDTNGGSFPFEIAKATEDVKNNIALPIGIHSHNDNGCATACSIEAVRAGATQVQGTFLGFGERCGNANLSTLIPNLQLKLGFMCIPEDKIETLTKTARFIAEISNLRLDHAMPYVGKAAFSHKGGMHIDGVMKNSQSFEHIAPEKVGNERRLLVSEVAGRSAVAEKLKHIDSAINRNDEGIAQFADSIKELERKGYQFESAGASMDIRALKYFGKYKPFFNLCYFKTIGEQPAADTDRSAAAVVKIMVDGKVEMTSEEGDGPVHALDKAIKKALAVFYPQVGNIRLLDYKVRVIDSGKGAAAMVRVLIESTDGKNVWTTVGASTDIIDASWLALVDSIEYKLLLDSNIIGT